MNAHNLTLFRDDVNMSLVTNNSYVKSMDDEIPFMGSSTVVTIVVYIVVFVVGLLGNTLAIYVILRYAKMKTVTNIYILNLALADELYILGLPFLTTHNVLSYWPFGEFLCRVFMTADTMNQFNSTFCLTVMSMDRYLAVVHPIRSAKWRRPRVAKVVNGVVWMVSLLVVLPVTIYSGVQDSYNSCNLSWPEPQDFWSTAFILYTGILGFFVPLLIICLCYLLIIIKVRTAGARAGLTKRRRSERMVTRMVVIILLVFVLCWLPFYITNMVNQVFIIPENSLMAGLYFFLVILTYVNSCANPFLYGLLSENFKQSFQKVLCFHKGNGVGALEPVEGRTVRSEKAEVTQDPLFKPREMNSNGHMQNQQYVQIESQAIVKTELLPSGTPVVDQSTL